MTLVGPTARCQQRQNLALPNVRQCHRCSSEYVRRCTRAATNSSSSLCQVGPRPVHRPICWERLRGILLRPGRGYAPFNDECGNFLGDPNVFVRRIICPCLLRVRSKRFCAEDRGFLSEAGQFPFGKPLTGVARPKMFCITAGLVQMDSYIGIARLVLLVTMHLVLCFLPCRQARDARHHGWYGPGGLVGFDVVPRAVFLLVSQAPDARHHGRHGPQGSVEVHRCCSWTKFSP